MNLLYIANARIPTEKAHGVHIVKMCQALASAGTEVTLMIPKRKNFISQDIFSYYGINKNFSVRYVPIIDLVGKGFIGYWVSQITFSLGLLFSKFNKKESIILTRDEWSGWLLAKFGYQVFYDMHGFPEKRLYFWKLSMKKMTGIICTNEWKIRQLQEKFLIPSEKIILARNGFDPNEFNSDIAKVEARKTLNLPDNIPIIMYMGHLYDWKGVGVLAHAAAFLKEMKVVFVGGSKKEVEDFKIQHQVSCDNIIMLGNQPHTKISLYLKSADVLVLPNSRKSKNLRAIPYSIYDTSPIKLFEYAASRRPIVASDLPSIREVLEGNMAVFFTPDDSGDLAQKIKDVLKNPLEVEKRVDFAWKFVQKYTWENRAKLIVEFVSNSASKVA